MRVGILGLGHAGLGHYETMSGHPGVSVVAVADTDPNCLRNPEVPIDVPSGSRHERPRNLLERESIDAIVVSTPPSTHSDYVLEALERDIHVLCEKPLCLDISKGRDIRDAVQASDAVLRVGFQRRVDPAFLAAKERLSDASISGFDVMMNSDWYPRFRDTWRTDPSVSGGGHLFDMGSHFVDTLLWLVGEDPMSVSAEMTFVDGDRRVDSQAALTLRLRNNVIGTLRFLTVESRAFERVELYGEPTVSVEATDWGDRSLTWIRDGRRQRSSPDTDTDLAAEFVKAVRGGDDNLATVTDALWVLRVLRAAYEAGRDNYVVSLSETQ